MTIVVLFGRPGSGKTTIANEIKRQKSDFKIVEASSCLIYPISKLKSLPNSPNSLLYKIKDCAASKKAKLDREKARLIFKSLQNKYSNDFIAKTLDKLYKMADNNLVFSGVRGYHNAEYFKNRGYLVVLLDAPNKVLVGRLVKKYHYTNNMAISELAEEEKLYNTKRISKIANMVIDTSKNTTNEITSKIINQITDKIIECKKCVNNNLNPSITFNEKGYCNVCASYLKNFDKGVLKSELEFVRSFRGKGKYKWDALVGVSGGKDSTNTLNETLKMGFKPLAFTFAIGYYPRHILRRGQRISRLLGVDHEIIVVKKYMRKCDLESYQKTAELYDKKESVELQKEFRDWYAEGRKHYSIKCRHAMPFVRTCQLCRRLVIRGYYGEAIRHGVQLVILGINEWTNLSQIANKNEFKASGIRKLKPYKNKPAVYVVHLPFLLQLNSKIVERNIKKLNWKLPRGENLIESNPNSCLFARAAQYKATKMLGFNPDTTRLAREVTVGFITKTQAKKALSKVSRYKYSVSYILKRAKILT